MRVKTAVQVVGRLEGLAGGRLLALGDEGGGLSVADLRMLGGMYPILTPDRDPYLSVAAARFVTSFTVLRGDLKLHAQREAMCHGPQTCHEHHLHVSWSQGI